MTQLTDLRVKAEEYASSIAKDIVLSLITCGIYYMFFWQRRKINAVNYLLGREEYSFGKWFLITLVTCGIYHVYHEYVMAQSIIEIQKKLSRYESANLPLLSVILTVFGIGIIADAIQQSELNKIFSK
ncbi:MAG: DUF4234 domain-containing protein [Nitrospinae bacterium]|nr:DUF4234 domain-containing protein [Nitrospinota bacterium]